jgi:predicted metal-dependent peptidase
MINEQGSSLLIPISREEFLKISSALEEFHKIFDVFWNLSSIYFASEHHACKTACVDFPSNGKSRMIINIAFWQNLNEDEKLFVIIHECLHIMLDHGIRNAKHIPGATVRLINVAQDITINEMIVDLFGFTRALIREWKKYCWIETCFEDPSVIESNQVFEYYLRKLISQNVDPGTELFDDHEMNQNSTNEMGETNGNEEYQNVNSDKTAQTLGEYLSFDELEKMIKSIEKHPGAAGSESSPFNTILKNRTITNIKFDQLVKRLKRTANSKNNFEEESFQYEHKRISSAYDNLFLPGVAERKPKQNKLSTLVFFDVSGSCMPYIDKLNSIKNAFEKEKHLFDVRVYAFDTNVKLISPENPIAVGGGTYFHIIEDECQKIFQQDKKYPDCVVVITDGEGNKVFPQIPSRWVWLLTKNSTTKFIDKASCVWPIENVTF